MVFEIININKISGLTKQFPKIIKYNFSTVKNINVKTIIKETEKEEKLKLSQHTKNLLNNNNKITNDTLNHNLILKKNGITKIENVDITTVTKPLKYPIVLCHGIYYI